MQVLHLSTVYIFFVFYFKDESWTYVFNKDISFQTSVDGTQEQLRKRLLFLSPSARWRSSVLQPSLVELKKGHV